MKGFRELPKLGAALRRHAAADIDRKELTYSPIAAGSVSGRPHENPPRAGHLPEQVLGLVAEYGKEI